MTSPMKHQIHARFAAIARGPWRLTTTCENARDGLIVVEVWGVVAKVLLVRRAADADPWAWRLLLGVRRRGRLCRL